MGYREEVFSRKFASAAHLLNTDVHHVVSLKARDNIGDYRAYSDLDRDLSMVCPGRYKRVSGDFGGDASLAQYGDDAIIIVQHETGLEILYISGSIASLVSLIPFVLGAWRRIRRKAVRPHEPPHPVYLEVRYTTDTKELVEMRIPFLLPENEEKLPILAPEWSRGSRRQMRPLAAVESDGTTPDLTILRVIAMEHALESTTTGLDARLSAIERDLQLLLARTSTSAARPPD